jgi:hypothetical protein
MATSYNGWTASPIPGVIEVDTNFSVLGTVPFAEGGFPGGVKAGPVSQLFTYLITQLHNRVEPMMVSAGGKLGYGCWGYGYRANVNNPSVLSCHASATAIDYNAPKHPNGTSTGPNGGGGWTGAQYKTIKHILDVEMSGAVAWLTSNDPMHFEIRGTELDIIVAAQNLPGNPGTPTDPAPSPEDDSMPFSEQQVKQMVRDGVKWALEDGAIDPVIIKAAVQSEVTKALGTLVGGEADFETFKSAVRNGTTWGIDEVATRKPSK